MPPNRDNLESEIMRLGAEILNETQSQAESMFSAEFYTSRLLGWAMKNEEFKTNLFRFIDVLPNLQRSGAIVTHAQEYFGPLKGSLPHFLRLALSVEPSSLTGRVGAQLVRRQVRAVAERFIVGEHPKGALKALKRIRKNGKAFTIDLLGEATVSEIEAKEYLDRYLSLLEVLKNEVPSWIEGKPLISGHRGEETPLNISVKLSALYSQVKALGFDTSVNILTERLSLILRSAISCGAFVYVDMEDTSLTEITLETFRRVAMIDEFRNYHRFGIVLQAYLRRTKQDIHELIEFTKHRGTPLGVRLVKGAYWDTETVLARQKDWAAPVWLHQCSSHTAYEECTQLLLRNHQLLFPAFGSHNVRSLCHAIITAEALGVSPEHYELQTLYGMADPFTLAFKKRGFLVREYSPIGDLITGMGYLVRRLLENTSNEGFLRLNFFEKQKIESLLKTPHYHPADLAPEEPFYQPRKAFSSVAPTDLSLAYERERVISALAKITDELQQRPYLVTSLVDGVPLQSSDSFTSSVVENPQVAIAEVLATNPSDVASVVSGLSRAIPILQNMAINERAEILFRAAELLEARRFELIATMILETGKQWEQADADVCEAIDFCNYYAADALKLFLPKDMSSVPGEQNILFYEPRGVTAVIGPWNFPLAIPCGMFAASIVTGNPTILKPAEQSSLIAYELFQTFIEAGLPPETAAFLPGIGEELGPAIVSHPDVATIVFTGSKTVGLKLIEQGAVTGADSYQVKRVIAEMGGKNAIIVDSDADLDEAVKGIVNSAFGYQGQKCSACSRVIIVEPLYERMLERLREATKSVIVGPASDPATLVGPVIDEEAYNRLTALIEQGRRDAVVVAEGAEGPHPSTRSNYIRPIIFADVPREHPLLTQETFGPIIVCEQAVNFREAIKKAQETEYALTGAVYSRSPVNIDLARSEFRVGNLYINRGSTGALVGRQPFGGHKLSGVGAKAGGPDYLLQFTIARAICENTMRRGFAPAKS